MPKKGKGKGPPKPPQPPLSRLQRVIKKIGLEEIFPDLSKMSDGDLQAALARFLHYGERHTEMGISSENFKFNSLPAIAFNKVKINPLRSPHLEPYFLTLSLREIDRLAKATDPVVNLDEPPADSDDFLGCRLFFRFVSEAVENGSRIVLMQDEQQSVAVVVHVKALRKLSGDPGTALLQVDYNCSSKADEHVMEVATIVQQLMTKLKCISIVGTEHQIHFVKQVLEAHERLLDKTVISEHDKEWDPNQKLIRPSFIVPLRFLPSDSELHIIQEIKGIVTPASEGASEGDPVESSGPSNESNSVPSGASVLINPMRDLGDGISLTLISNRDSPDTPPKVAKTNHMPDHKEGELYVVKAQAGPEDHCLIYDRERSFTIMTVDPEEQAVLRPAITAVKHKGGEKAYFYAKNEGDRFRVYLENRPEQYVNW